MGVVWNVREEDCCQRTFAGIYQCQRRFKLLSFNNYAMLLLHKPSLVASLITIRGKSH
jgi:hypothetical protein